jgi:hypothetical protein
MLPPPLQLGITVTASLCITAAHCRQSTNFCDGPCIYYSSVSVRVLIQKVHKNPISGSDARSEVFTAVKIQVEVFWFVMPCSDMVGYHRFGGQRCLHLHCIRTQNSTSEWFIVGKTWCIDTTVRHSLQSTDRNILMTSRGMIDTKQWDRSLSHCTHDVIGLVVVYLSDCKSPHVHPLWVLQSSHCFKSHYFALRCMKW